jgi:hypothetical protein
MKYMIIVRGGNLLIEELEDTPFRTFLPKTPEKAIEFYIESQNRYTKASRADINNCLDQISRHKDNIVKYEGYLAKAKSLKKELKVAREAQSAKGLNKLDWPKLLAAKPVTPRATARANTATARAHRATYEDLIRSLQTVIQS